MDKAWVIAKREFLERVRTWWFIAVSLMGPIGMMSAMLIPAYLGLKTVEKGLNIEIVDKTGRDVASRLNIDLEFMDIPIKIKSVDPKTPEDELLSRVSNKEIDGFLSLPKNFLEEGEATYKGDNATNEQITGSLEQLVSTSAFRIKGKDLGLTDEQSEQLFKKIEIQALHTTGTSEAKEGQASFFVGYLVNVLLYMAIMLYASNVLRSVVLEKTNRVVELVISTVSPKQLMLGKMFGVAAVGVLQMTIWGVLATVLFKFRGPIFNIFGLGKAAGVLELPSIGLDVLLLSLLYFVLGYLFYAALYAAVGAMVNSEQEAQQAQTPVMLLLLVPVACVQIVASDARGDIAKLLTMIPTCSPILMPQRIVLEAVSKAELLLSIGILCISTFVAIWLASRIYRVGILMHGKKPTLSELLRWIRAG